MSMNYDLPIADLTPNITARKQKYRSIFSVYSICIIYNNLCESTRLDEISNNSGVASGKVYLYTSMVGVTSMRWRRTPCR